MRVLVTGGAGFIGSHVAALAEESGYEVAVLDDFSTGSRANLRPGARVYDVDLRDREATTSAVRDFAPDLVSHQAAQVSVARSRREPLLDAQVNVVGGLHLLEACGAAGVRVERLVFASTAAIYGDLLEGERAHEGSRVEPLSPYGVTKLAFEQLLAFWEKQRGLTSRVLRYSNVYGPRQAPRGESGVVAEFFAAARGGRALTVFGRRRAGDGGCERDYVYVGDVARANLLALRGELPHAVTNVATGRATSTRALAERIAALVGTGAPVRDAPPRAGDAERSLLDPSRVESVLGALTPLEAGLLETARWYREH
ncbi:MAG: NAD-dependent epimerase/dehydratase family protein [Myxococcales bacterium]|nr:MAG: NAD-dependent epimerase/dehydratase family protein [Myxococcales bacterium]